MLKCKLCGQNHTAKFKDCPKRIEYKKIREAVRANNTKTPRKHPPPQQPHPPAWNNQQAFPSLTGVIQPPNNQSSQQRTFASFLQQPHPTNTAASGLFTPAECFAIFEELYAALVSCKTREQQLFVITQICCKRIESTVVSTVPLSTVQNNDVPMTDATITPVPNNPTGCDGRT